MRGARPLFVVDQCALTSAAFFIIAGVMVLAVEQVARNSKIQTQVEQVETDEDNAGVRNGS